MVQVKNSPPKVRNKQGCLHSPLPFNIVLEVLARAIRQEKEKGIQAGKEEVKHLCSQMNLHTENPEELTTLPPNPNQFSKAAGYKINTQKISCVSTHPQ